MKLRRVDDLPESKQSKLAAAARKARPKAGFRKQFAALLRAKKHCAGGMTGGRLKMTDYCVAIAALRAESRGN